MHVLETTRHGLVRLRPDGWRPAQDQWLAVDGGEVYPPGWCRRTGHPLTPPVTGAQTAPGCRTAGCAGLGNTRGERYRRHDVTEQCPYRGETEEVLDRRTAQLPEEDDLQR